MSTPARPTLHLLLLLALLGVGAGCAWVPARRGDATPAVASYFPRVPSLAPLTGVRLGMTHAQLRTARPAAVPREYVGAIEEIAGDTVRYHFDRGRARSLEQELSLHPPPPEDDAPLVSVSDRQWVESVAAAEALWRERVRELQRGGAAHVRCFTLPSHDKRGVRAVPYAIREDSVAALGVNLSPPNYARDGRGGWLVERPPAVRTFVTTRLTNFVPPTVPQQAMACPR